MQQKWNQNFDGEPMTDIPQKFLNAGCDVYMVMQLRHDEKILDERFASSLLQQIYFAPVSACPVCHICICVMSVQTQMDI